MDYLEQDIQCRAMEKLAMINMSNLGHGLKEVSGKVSPWNIGSLVGKSIDPYAGRMGNLRFKLEQMLGAPVSSVDDFTNLLSSYSIPTPRAANISDVLKPTSL